VSFFLFFEPNEGFELGNDVASFFLALAVSIGQIMPIPNILNDID
jgi:hypothetical protein